MKVTTQAPAPRLELYNIDSPDNPYLTYLPDPKANVTTGIKSTNLLSYSFSQSIYNISGSFSFSVADELFGELPVYHKITIRSILKIFENSKDIPVFIGIVHKKQFSASMTASGIQKTISFSGSSILSILNDLVISLDPVLMGVKNAGSLSTQLTTDLANNNVKDAQTFMKTIYTAFTSINAQGNIVANTALLKAIDCFCGGIDSVLSYGENVEFFYNIAAAFYNQGDNRITDVWRMILPEPAYEIFEYNKEGKPQIMVRETPFEQTQWCNLPTLKVLPEYLISYELTMSDEEVFTVFNSYLEGSSMNSQFYTTIDNYGGQPAIVINEDKYKIYGYKPLNITFRGFSRNQNINEKTVNDIQGKKQEMNKRVEKWYGKQDEMLNGSFRIVNDFNSKDKPQVGGKLEFDNYEYYVVGTEHSFQYGGTPVIQISVSRGQKKLK